LGLQASERHSRGCNGLIGATAGHDRDLQVVTSWHHGRRSERDDDVGSAADIQAGKTRWRDSDNCEGHAIQHQRAPDDIRRCTVLPLPKGVTNNGNRAINASVPTIVRIGEHSSKQRREAEGLEIRSAYPGAGSDLCLSAWDQVEFSWRPRQGSIEDIHKPSKRLPHTKRVRSHAWHGGVSDEDKCTWIPDGQLAKQQTVGEREDNDACADSESE
jgi:hypothetical protein